MLIDLITLGDIKREVAGSPIISPRLIRRQRLAHILCDRAQTPCAWLMADRLAKAWELGGCAAIGIPAKVENEAGK